VSDSAAYEEWALLTRERLQRQMLAALQRLIEAYEQRGDYERACAFAWRQVALAAWQEGAHRTLMRLLALNGQRGAALAQYEACRRALSEELDVEPGEETKQLYEQIRDGLLAPPRSEARHRREDDGRRTADDESPGAGAGPPAADRGTRDGASHAPARPAALRPDFPPQHPQGTPKDSYAPLAGERRTATVLVTDVKGSTALAEQIDTEDWVALMSEVLQTLGSEIYRYGGEVDQFQGDGLIAFFGVSTAHEDDPERAVLAALAMQVAIKRYAAGLSPGPGAELSVRVGINTGQVIAASIGDQAYHREETARGRAIALAERMEKACQPGTVLVAEETYRLTAPLFEWQPLGEIRVEDVSQPVAVYRPLAHVTTTGKGRGIAGLESPLVGRDAALRALENAIERLQSGVGGIVTVVGEAGIGKSRLVAEIRKLVLRGDKGSASLESTHLQWVEGRCLSYATTVAYHLWLDMLPRLLQVAPDARPTAVRHALRERVLDLCPDRVDDVYPYLGRLMSLPLETESEARLRGLDAESLQYLTFRAVEILVESTARERPLVMVGEDLHWADPTSLDLLVGLLSATDRAPLLVLCLLRPERSHPCWRIIERAVRDYPHRHTDLRLKPLSADESETLVENLLHVEALPVPLRARILDHAEGNPFFVEEILRSLIDDGTILHDAQTDRWYATRDVDDIPIPNTLHGALTARIDRLESETKRVLQLASVIGRIFSSPLLSAIYADRGATRGGTPEGAGGNHIEAHLIALQRAQLIRERARLPEREYIFKHHLTQKAAYGGLLRRERRAYHRRAAETLEQLYPERIEEQLGLLAHHWERAGEVERAVVHLRRAGEQSAAQYANAEAVAYFSRALKLIPEPDDTALHAGRGRLSDVRERCALLLAREDIYDLQGERDAQRQDLDVLVKLTEALAQEGGQQVARLRATIALRQARYAEAIYDRPAAVEAARVAVRLAREAQAVEIEALGHRHWGLNLSDGRHEQAARTHFEQALDLARAAGSHRVEASSLRGLGILYYLWGDFGTARTYGEQALGVCREVADRREEMVTLNRLGWLCVCQGDYAGARAFLEQALSVCREIGSRQEEGWALCILGRIFHVYGDYARARGHYEQGLRALSGADDWLENVVLAYEGLLFHDLGDDETARRWALQAVENLGEGLERGYALTVLGHALAGLGHLDEAADAYQRASALWRERRIVSTAPDAWAGLARVALARGEPAQALGHVQEILGCLETYPTLESTLEPLVIYMTCYRVLRTCAGLRGRADPRAREVLHAAHGLLQEQAAHIDDETLRRSFLENVVVHRQIVAEFEQDRGCDAIPDRR
jgi:class 3 adenylate cyclase